MKTSSNRIIWLTLLLFVTALIADQISTRILISRDGISGESNEIIKMFWNQHGSLWIIGDVLIVGLTYVVTYLLTGLEERGAGIAFSKYAFVSLVLASATIKFIASCKNMEHLFTKL